MLVRFHRLVPSVHPPMAMLYRAVAHHLEVARSSLNAAKTLCGAIATRAKIQPELKHRGTRKEKSTRSVCKLQDADGLERLRYLVAAGVARSCQKIGKPMFRCRQARRAPGDVGTLQRPALHAVEKPAPTGSPRPATSRNLIMALCRQSDFYERGLVVLGTLIGHADFVRSGQ